MCFFIFDEKDNCFLSYILKWKSLKFFKLCPIFAFFSFFKCSWFRIEFQNLAFCHVGFWRNRVICPNAWKCLLVLHISLLLIYLRLPRLIKLSEFVLRDTFHLLILHFKDIKNKSSTWKNLRIYQFNFHSLLSFRLYQVQCLSFNHFWILTLYISYKINHNVNVKQKSSMLAESRQKLDDLFFKV